MIDGDAVIERRDGPTEFSRLKAGRCTSVDGREDAGTDVSLAGATPDTLVVPVVTAVILRVLRFDDDRCRRADVGTIESLTIDAEDAFDTTEAV